ncbi:DUF4232 domain-containing protein [Kocuria rhizosphaericola]|uniref:DUF4232 domain-containing protein n=1 Tax=Kocuria rhizosphaericola TaxID=3376284 RepID=UPI00378A4CA8
MSSLIPVSRPVLGALALALALTACAGPEADRAGSGSGAESSAAPSRATPAGTATGTGAGNATEPAGAGTGEQSEERTGDQADDPSPDPPTAEPAESRAADDPADGTNGGGRHGAADDAAEGGTAAGGGTTGARTGSGTPLCTTSQLELAAAPVGGAAGSVHVDLVLTNAGESPCTLAGYAGVSFVDAAGTIIGSPAVRDATVPGTGRVVAPGASASAGLRVSQAGNHPTCDARTASGLRVYPPENTESVVIPFPVEACGDPQIHQLEIQGLGA